MKRFSLAVFVARASPPHNGHMAVIEQALSVAESVLIILGSSNAARRHDFVPFTAEEREQMFRLSLSADDNLRVQFARIEDQGNTPVWATLVRKAANRIEPNNKRVTLIGHSKDNSSYYLKHFPGWDATDVENYAGLSSTDFRKAYFKADNLAEFIKLAQGKLPEPVIDFMMQFIGTADGQRLVAEAAKCADDLAKYGHADPETGAQVYGPFLTADSIIVQGDHVLVIERGGHPFKGCLAFPGGFVEHDEDVIEAAIRETVEETGLKVPAAILRRSIIRTEPFSAPFRDPRGRVVTFATFFKLDPAPPALDLPRVKGGDDAAKAFWIPIGELSRDTMAFDHFTILQRMLDYLPKED